MALPEPPKPLRSFGSATVDELSKRLDEWARGLQALAAALRDQDKVTQRRLDDLEARVTALE